MKELSQIELTTVNGGKVPQVSGNSDVQSGYSFGYRFGRALANTINMFKGIF
jgi:hypothetical protein